MNPWHIFHFLLFAGAIQGIVLGSILWQSTKVRKIANRFLAVLLFFFSYRLIAEALKSMAFIGVDSWTYHVFLEYNWIYGALIYFYIRSFLQPKAGLTKKDWVHFLPIVIEFFISNYVKFQNFFWDGTRESLSWLGTQAYILWMHTPFNLVISSLLILYYVKKSKALLQTYTAANTRPVETEDSQWVRQLLVVYQVLSVVIISVALLDYVFFNFAFNPFYKFPVYGLLAVVTYWLGLKGFSLRNAPYLQPKKHVHLLPSDHLNASVLALKKAMEVDKLFQNPTLTLSNLAEAVGLKPYQLSQVLNQSLKRSFSDFVNQYRVEEATRLINSDDFEKYTLLSIAYESGFNSKASFNRVVKKMTGKPPKALRRQKL